MNGFIGYYAPQATAASGISAQFQQFCRHFTGRRVIQTGPLALSAANFRQADGAWLGWEGRLDNAEDLRRAVIAPAADESALLLELVRRSGIPALAKLRGRFALACWDDAAQQLLLAGDQLGLNTVFYARLAGGLVFSSSLRALLALPGLKRDLDEGYLAALLCDVVPEADATLYTAIRRVPAACALLVDRAGNTKMQQYWQPDWRRRIRHRQDQDYVEEARALLDQAVRRQIAGLDPLVCQLSGGLDSGAVAATAARLRPGQPVHVLTMAPPDGVARRQSPHQISDERPAAQSVAALHPNMRWQGLTSAVLHRLDHNPQQLFLALGMPVRGMMNIAWFGPLFDQARALGANAILTGNFGNMTLTWDGTSGLAGWARNGRWLRLGREIAALHRQSGIAVAKLLYRHALRPLLSPAAQHWLDRQRGLTLPDARQNSAIHPDFAALTGIDQRGLALGHDYDGDTETMRRRWLSRIQTLPPILAPLGEMLGLELRDPTADIDLLEYCFAVPDEQYLRHGTSRWLARRVLADRLPPQVLNETRRGLQGADFLHRMTLQRENSMAMLAALRASPLAARVLDLDRMQRLMADWPTDAAAAGFGEYGAVLNRGLHIGAFLRWIEGGNQ